MSTTAVMTEGGLGRGCRRKARKILKRPDQVEGAAGIVYIFSIFIIKYFSHGFL